MNYETMNIDELRARMADLETEIATADAERLDAINAEIDAIKARKNELKKEAEERAMDVEEVLKASEPTPIIEERKIEIMETRNTKEYIEAYAKYIKTGKDTECRALLTENVEGTVPVPEFIESRIRTAWENNEIFRRITKTYVRGNLKVGFERESDPAVFHAEGTAAPAEENLLLGIVNLVPHMIKKWITVSDEVLALGSEEFLNYIYDEITYKIIQKASDEVVNTIFDSPDTSSATAVGVPYIDSVINPGAILDAVAKLGDNARDLVFIANGGTIADIKKVVLDSQYPFDPFAGMTVIKSGALEVNTAIVGDLSGVQANFPEGDSVKFKFDDLSLAEKDLVKIVGRLYAAIAVVEPGMFVTIGES